MKLHADARLSVKGRELLIDRTARKWLARYRVDGPAGLVDRSSAPTLLANRTDERRIEAIARCADCERTREAFREFALVAPRGAVRSRNKARSHANPRRRSLPPIEGKP